jgi:catechol-2,3-dioxygenase
MVKFYTQVVGYRETDQVVDEQGILKTSFLRSNHEHHSLAFFQASEAKLDHHCYEAGDWGLIRDWGDHFSKHGIPVRWGPGRHGPGNNLFMFVHDADGNWVEISAELETVGPERTIGIWPHEELTLNKWGSAFLRG